MKLLQSPFNFLVLVLASVTILIVLLILLYRLIARKQITIFFKNRKSFVKVDIKDKGKVKACK